MPPKRNKDVARLVSRQNNWTPEGVLPQLALHGNTVDANELLAQVARSKLKSTEVVTQKINLAPGVGSAAAVAKAKGHQAWKYPNYTIQRADSIALAPSNSNYTDDKDPSLARRKHESNFLITINPNQKHTGANAIRARAAFKAGITAITTGETFAQTLIFGPKSDWYHGDLAADVIKEAAASASVEEGGKLHRMHCHVILEITHYSQIQIDPKKCVAVFIEAFNATLPDTKAGPEVAGSDVRITKKPYIQVKLLPQSNWQTIMRQYVKKAMAGPPPPGEAAATESIFAV